MSAGLWRASLRHLARRPGQIGLSVLGIALGVAVALAVGLATGSARRAFELATEAVTGRATHQIVGGPTGLSEDVYRMLRLDLGVQRAAPVVALDVAAPDHPGRVFQLLGVDPFAEAPFRPHFGSDDPLGTVAALVTRPGAIVMSGPTARALGLAPGATLTIRVAGARHPLTLVGTVEPADPLSTQALESVLVTDIATAQELAGNKGRLSRIDLIIGFRPADRALLERIRRALPPGVELARAGAQAEATASMTAAFTLNLRALSLLALVVGMFLIYNTMTFSVVQRRALLGTLRALGVTRGEVFTLVTVEALALGAVGTLLGIGLGLALAQGLLHLVTRTINDLYFALSVREVWLTPGAVLEAAGLGLGTTVLAALAPAREATGIRPREALVRSRLEAASRRAAPRAALAGLALGAVGVLALVPRGPVWGFVGLFAILMGAALMTPLAVAVLLRALDRPIARAGGLLGRMAARAITAAPSRTGVAIAALMIAVSATIGVGVMIASFREAVLRWLEGTLRADVYVAPPSLVGSRPDATLDPALVQRLATAPGVAAAGTARGVTVASARGPVHVVAIGMAAGHAPGFAFKRGRPEAVWPQVDKGAVIVSEPFAYRRHVGVGDRVRLRTREGEQAFPIAGIFYDYGSSAGVVMMSRATYERHWADRGVSSLALYAAPGVDLERLIAELRARAAAGPVPADVLIRSNRALREASLAIFDRTFAVTRVLRFLIVVVAFVGVLSALMALALERVRELGLQRALGLTPGQVWGVITAQTGLMGLVAGLLAIPVGVLLAGVLVFVINRRSFGWTMPIDVHPAILLQGLLLAVAAALLAGAVPAARMARASPVEALRDE
ncbi:MAG TPA: FtsX-like permease family protein [Methylomirabilota bacterium]|nr:FtsX-like permease family protein [Methylomirabilota bacterium]